MTLMEYFQYFVIAGICNTLLFGLLLKRKIDNKTASGFLFLFMLLASFQALLNAFDNAAFFMEWPHLSRISWLLPSLFGPLLYLVVRKMTRPHEGIRLVDATHLMAFALYLAYLWKWFFQPASIKRELLTNFAVHSEEDFGWLNQLSIGIITIYTIWSFLELKKYRLRLENSFSEIGLWKLQWLQQFLWFFAGILMISALAFYGRKWNIPWLGSFYHFNYALVVGLLYWIAYKWIVQPGFPLLQGEDVEDETKRLNAHIAYSQVIGAGATPVAKYARSGLTTSRKDEIFECLDSFMRSKKPFLNDELNIEDLAQALGVRRHHLSQVINEKTRRRFYDYINGFRVEELIGRMADPGSSHLSLFGLALECGFKSKATFNAAFKKQTGRTPSAYQRSLKKKYEPVGPVDSHGRAP